MSDTANTIVALVLAYLAGSVPFGLLIGFARGVDLRAHGSGNIGATNAMRVLGKRLGSLCFALDVLKGLLPTLLLGLWLGVAGNRFPTTGQAFTHLGRGGDDPQACVPSVAAFRGGKGVASGVRRVLGVFPQITVPAAGRVPWCGSRARVTRYVSLSSIVAACAAAADRGEDARVASEAVGAFEAASRA